ncbi:hypothetical protein MTO96_003936 [Rhipicephalus appendiculatus]
MFAHLQRTGYAEVVTPPTRKNSTTAPRNVRFVGVITSPRARIAREDFKFHTSYGKEEEVGATRNPKKPTTPQVQNLSHSSRPPAGGPEVRRPEATATGLQTCTALVIMDRENIVVLSCTLDSAGEGPVGVHHILTTGSSHLEKLKSWVIFCNYPGLEQKTPAHL